VRVAVISDTHGNIKAATQALSMAGKTDMVVHAGDYFSDAAKLQRQSDVPVIGVKGNCDRLSFGPLEEILDVAGVKIYLTHGHSYGVKHSMAELQKRVSKLRAQVVIYGHTHVPQVEWVDGSLYLNPGSLHSPRGSNGKTFAVLDIGNGQPSAQILELEA